VLRTLPLNELGREVHVRHEGDAVPSGSRLAHPLLYSGDRTKKLLLESTLRLQHPLALLLRQPE
jgi:hypothetical protein